MRHFNLQLVLLLLLIACAAHAQEPVSADNFSQRGISRFEKHDFEGAIADFTKAIELKGQQLEYCYYFRGIALYRRGRLDDAIADLGKAITLKQHPRFYADRGNLLVQRGDLDGGMADLNKAVELEPKFAKAYGDRGLVHLMRGEDTDAELDFRRCFELDKTLEFQFKAAANQLRQQAVLRAEHQTPADVEIVNFNWTEATRQEMRAFVCGQCHDEYHFSGPEKRLVYPWAKGLLVENILAFYDEQKFKDWDHAQTGAPVLKAQHPEFEMWNQGIHARSGVACADCHMPYKREGALKISDHHVRSPLLNINRACQTCHKWSEEELKARVENIQSRTHNLRNLAMDALVDLINDIKAARDSGHTDSAVVSAQDFQRRAQFYVDFIESENSNGFHASQEAARILGESINFSRKGQIALRGGSQSTSAQTK